MEKRRDPQYTVLEKHCQSPKPTVPWGLGIGEKIPTVLKGLQEPHFLGRGGQDPGALEPDTCSYVISGKILVTLVPDVQTGVPAARPLERQGVKGEHWVEGVGHEEGLSPPYPPFVWRHWLDLWWFFLPGPE